MEVEKCVVAGYNKSRFESCVSTAVTTQKKGCV